MTTVFAIGAGDCFAQNVKALAKDNGSKSAPIYNSKNGHYYEFVGEKELTWPQAKQRAASRYLVVNGRKLRGYLVTLTSKDEQELLAKHYLDPPATEGLIIARSGNVKRTALTRAVLRKSASESRGEC